MARLRIVGGEGVERVLDLREGRLQIGRGRENGLVLPGAEKGVSRTHAELRFENGTCVIVDLQSQNGTWVNGRRVERAEVPMGAEIAVGEYRLTLQPDAPAPPASVSFPEARTAPIGELRMRELSQEPSPAAAPTPVAKPRWVMRGALTFALVLVALVWWNSLATPPAPSAATAAAEVPAAPSSDAASQEPSAAAARVSATGQPTPVAADRLPESSPIRDKPESATTEAGRAADARVSRKPGESAEAWRTRTAALQMRYGYSKAALDRNDFAAAAGGFEAILLEEPGFLDAPKLLVQAQSGMRASANNLFKAGKKLDAAGDWTGALQKYEQARQIYSAIPGISESLQRVREKLKAAGTAAFTQAQQHEVNGRPQEALKEYQKAIQWLAADDPNRHLAQTRVDKLRRN
ncbi:hypothetical protein BH18ACI5_BH18ACI5_21440 [soil metagenome]